MDRDIFMRYLGLGIGHTIVGKPAVDDAEEEEAVELGTGPLDDQHDDWGNQSGEQDMDDKAEEEEADDEDEELEEEDDDNYSDTDLGYDDL